MSFNGVSGMTIVVQLASHVGFTDFGGNALRLNCIRDKCWVKGWMVVEIMPKYHQDNWTTANKARDANFDSYRHIMDSKAYKGP